MPASASIPPSDSPLAAFASAWADALVVFCGSSPGNDPAFVEAARQLGNALARRSKPLVYGGGTTGLMGATALACHGAGGRVHGVIPAALASCERKATNTPADLPSALRDPTPAASATESDRSVVSVVDDMHTRKMLMSNHGNGFIVLPGGFGTLEECMLSWHRKPTIVLDVAGFYAPLRAFVEQAIASGFIPKPNGEFITWVTRPSDAAEWDWGEAALDAVEAWQAKAQGGVGVSFGVDWSARGASVKP